MLNFGKRAVLGDSFGNNGLWGSEQHLLRYCWDCKTACSGVRATMKHTLVSGRVCPLCNKKDSCYTHVIRPAASVLLDIGFQFKGVQVSLYRSVENRNNAEWKVCFQLKRDYPKDVFKGLSRKFRRYKGPKQLVTELHYTHEHPIVHVFTPDDVTAFNIARYKKLTEVSSEMTLLLKQWLYELNMNGNLAVWRLAGYFD